jgi:SAM-dependent methyltransferase
MDETRYRLSTTDSYHRQDLKALGWELTVCNSLYPADTPVRRVLVCDASYGQLLYDHLKRFIPLDRVGSVLEIGGGYGYLMRDFLSKNERLRPAMLDISPALLEKQKEALAGYEASYLLEDALDTDAADLQRYELVILNENLGDFPTAVDVDHHILEDVVERADQVAEKIRRFFETYSLERPAGHFNFNLGAMEIVERLCSAGIPYIFVGEHSCEGIAPPGLKPFITVSSDGNPRRIPLKGHDEYTIKFSHLQRVAQYHGYRTARGPFADYIVPSITEGLKAVLATRGLYSDSEEMIYHFIGDLYEYEYLVMVKEEGGG